MSWLLAVVFAIACAETDPGITTAVKSKLAADDQVKAYRIDVDTNNGVVTLSGEVDSTAGKTRAVEIARGTDGVSNVVDNLTIRPAMAETPRMPDVDRATLTDPAITTAVKAQLAADTLVRARTINVDTSAGVVTLTGDVRSNEERDQALKVARETGGVKDVIDKLTVAR
jgi:hyperosmotically inducible protein